MVWIATDDAEGAAIQELQSLPDRACAIVAAALLEARLESALKHALQDASLSNGATVHSRMFYPSGPLGSFGSKIELGFMIRLYSLPARKDIKIINDIRNKFAHKIRVSSFENVRNECFNLSNFEQHFFLYGTSINPERHMMMAEPDLDEHLKIPRHRFLMAVRLYAAALLTVPVTRPNELPR
jgi:hypothetical protein